MFIYQRDEGETERKLRKKGQSCREVSVMCLKPNEECVSKGRKLSAGHTMLIGQVM